MATAINTPRKFAITALENQISFLLCSIQRNSQTPMFRYPDLRHRLKVLQRQLETCKDCWLESNRDSPWCPHMCAHPPSLARSADFAEKSILTPSKKRR